jgi:hypothetical protein
MPDETFEAALRDILDDDLTLLLDEAEVKANERRIFARRRGSEGYYTIQAALQLAIAVWGVESTRRDADG